MFMPVKGGKRSLKKVYNKARQDEFQFLAVNSNQIRKTLDFTWHVKRGNKTSYLKVYTLCKLNEEKSY